MRRILIATAILSLLLFSACGGKKTTNLPQYEDPEPVNMGNTEDISANDITETEDITEDQSVGLGDDARVEEKPLTEMSLEEINAAEFLKNVFFDFDKFDLTDSAIMQLETNGKWLTANPSVKVIIEGHCDERGTEEYNLALGEKRANAARDFLIRYSISPGRLMTASYGESRPLDPRASEDAYQRNRRAHFRIYSR